MVENVAWERHVGAVWREYSKTLRPIEAIEPFGLEDLVGIDEQKARVVENTERFLAGQPRNHVLLWGSRGMGKSSLIKALLNTYASRGLRVVEFPRESLGWLPEIADRLRHLPYRFIVYCDDLSFESGESGYKGLKTILEGSLEAPPENMVVYATSNRRHLVPEYMSDNLGATVGEAGELHFSDSVEERISLADRFGLSVGFYQGGMTAYEEMVRHYFKGYGGDWETLFAEARRFSQQRASRSGRTAKQFYNHYVAQRPRD